jgi:hypothetical protein
MKNENLTLLATKLGSNEAEAFRALAVENNTTVSRMLSNYIRTTLAENAAEPNPTGSNVAILTYANVDRLKHEVAFHNPKHLNPDEMLNHILNQYFKMVTEVRKTT